MSIPNRRPHFVELLAWGGADWLLGIGLDHAGVAVEVFADPADTRVEVDADVLALVHETCITASHLLQQGVAAASHADRIGGQRPALLTLALRRAVEVERREGNWVRLLHGWREQRLRAGSVTCPRAAE